MAASSIPSRALSDRTRRRSVAFLERGGESWACFLVSFPDGEGGWRGYFSFRPRAGDLPEDEIRTADIFIESSPAEIDEKARGLGRPLLASLLASALHLRERRADGSPRLRRWFRSMLSENSLRIAGAEAADPDADDLPALRSLYASYRLDQVAHLIALLDPSDFEGAVEAILDGREIDFRGRDRLQLAMIVVEQLESLLPLPPFEIWLEDYSAHPEAYRLYAHTLHRARRLP